jgi:transcriptional regulator with PAS, ATPase and Fis domain
MLPSIQQTAPLELTIDGSNGGVLVGRSAALLSILDKARKIALSDADVLIEAESGTGKELLARFIHVHSPRRFRPFIAVNCSAVPEALLESELFGHVRGAFTGATGNQRGKFELANGGTLLLDEIGEMPLVLQPKLLRVLQEREFDPLGAVRPVRTDIRIIATSNRTLLRLVEEGVFRADLFYRLNVIPLTLPPLRDRKEDIPELAVYFLRKFATAGVPDLSPVFLEGLALHDWPGNIRELANFMRRVGALCTTGEVGHEFLELLSAQRLTQTEAAISVGLSLREAEKRLLEATLRATAGNRTRAAELLGVSLRTIRNKIRDYGLPPRRFA